MVDEDEGFVTTKDIEMWVDKYEPQTLAEVVGQEDIVRGLVGMAESVRRGEPGVMHMMFLGPPGVGKSLFAKLFAKECFGNDYEQAFEMMDASGKERGIDVVRTRIPKIASTQAIGFPMKIIFLDEADMMTSELQHALRGTMVKWSKTTLFLFAANYGYKIISPIRNSRCTEIVFERLTDEDVKSRLVFILKKEGVHISEEIIDEIVRKSRGDMRASINKLQFACLLHSKGVNDDGILRLIGRFKSFDVSQVLGFCKTAQLSKLDEYVANLLQSGAPAIDFLTVLSDFIFIDESLSSFDRMEILVRIADAVDAINHGSPERVQVNAVVSRLFVAMMPGGGQSRPPMKEGMGSSFDAFDGGVSVREEGHEANVKDIRPTQMKAIKLPLGKPEQ